MAQKLKAVMIVDDEFLVRMGFKSIINWQEIGFEVVGEAQNEREALSLFEQASPDVLICDIRLGSVNGLDLMNRLKQQKSDMKVIMLTHYDDFDYVRKAFRMGADEYILKSDFSPQLLTNTLKKLFVNEKGAFEQTPERSSSEVINLNDMLTTAMRERMSSNLFQQTLIDKYANMLFVVAISKLYFSQDSPLGIDHRDFEKSATAFIGDSLRERHAGFSVQYEQDELFMVFMLDGSSNQDDFTIISNCVRHLRKSVKNILGIESITGVSSAKLSPEFLGIMLQEAEAALEYSYFEDDFIFEYDSIASRTNRFKKQKSLESPNLKTIWKLIKEREEKMLNGYIERIFDGFKEKGSVEDLRNAFNDFMSYIKLIAKEQGYEASPALSAAKFSYTVFDCLCGINAVKKYVEDMCVEALFRPVDANASGYSYIIRKCINYIKQNYNSNITLGDLADHAQVSRSYLSMLFKQEMNITFSNYLCNYRVDQAKKLMLKSNYKMYEIAEKTGFDNPYYFSKVFKEVTGLTCKEFRNSHGVLQEE